MNLSQHPNGSTKIDEDRAWLATTQVKHNSHFPRPWHWHHPRNSAMAPRRLTKLTSEAGDAKPLVKSEFPTAVSPLDKDGEPLLVSALLLSLMDIASLSSAGSLSSLSGEASLSSLSIKLLSTNSVVEV